MYRRIMEADFIIVSESCQHHAHARAWLTPIDNNVDRVAHSIGFMLQSVDRFWLQCELRVRRTSIVFQYMARKILIFLLLLTLRISVNFGTPDGGDDDVITIILTSFVLSTLQTLYESQMKMICDWLTDRIDCSLHPYQLACLLNITRVSTVV